MLAGWLWALAAVALGAEPLLLDAGGAGSPVLAGFARLDPAGSTDPRATWTQPPVDARWAAEPDALAGDGLVGGVLHLDLEPGAWTLYAMQGAVGRPGPPWFQVTPGRAFGLRVDDEEVLHEEVPAGAAFLASRWYALDPFPTFRSGETEWDRQVDGRFTWRSATVRVGPGGIDVAPFGAVLRGLVAVPADQPEQAEVLFAMADAQRRAWYREHVAPQAATWTPPPGGSGPLSVEIARWRDLPDPERATSTPALSWAVAPGERRGTAVWLFPGDGAASWHAEGLEGVQVEGWEIHWLDRSGQIARARRPRPAFLVPSDGSLRGGQGVPVGLGLVLRVAGDATPGEHDGAIVLTRGDDSVTVPVHLRVRALQLAPLPVPVGFFADVRPALTMATGNGSPQVLHGLDADFAAMRARGLTAVALGKASPWPKRWTKGSLADPELLDEAVRRWRASGPGPFVWMDPFRELVALYRHDASDGARRLGRANALATRAVQEGTWVYAYDEEGGRDVGDVARGRQIAEALHDATPGVRLVAAIPHPVDWAGAGSWDVALVGMRPRIGSDELEIVGRTGASPWSYNLTPGRSAPGLLLWGIGARGLLQWHWDAPGGDPFDEAHRGVQSQYALLAPGGEAVWPTVLLESFADGVVDHRYLATLQGLVGRAEASHRPRVRAAAAPGRALLDAVHASVEGAWPVGVHDGSIWSEAALDTLRRAVGDEAERLQAILDGARPARPAPAPAPAAAPLRVTVRGPERLPRPRPWAPPAPAGIPVVRAPSVTVDGRLDDPAWQAAPTAPPLRALATGGPAPDARLRVAVTDAGLALAVDRLPAGSRATVLVDPDGTQQRWMRLDLGSDSTFQVCGFEGLHLVAERHLDARAAPCAAPEATPVAIAGDEAGWEVLLPWPALGQTTEWLGIAWQVADAGGVTGTWSPRLDDAIGPADVVPLDVPHSGARLALHTVPGTGHLEGSLHVPDPGTSAHWHWVLRDRGETLGSGDLALAGKNTRVSIPNAGHELYIAEAVADRPTPFRAAARAVVRWDDTDARVVTPAFDDTLEVAVRLPWTAKAVPIEVRGPDSRVLGTASADFPAGSSALAIAVPPGWPDTVIVHLGAPLDRSVPAVRARSFP